MAVNKPNRSNVVNHDKNKFNRSMEGKTLKATTVKIRESQLIALQDMAHEQRLKGVSELLRNILQEHGIT